MKQLTHRTKTFPVEYDPIRRLLAAVVIRAIQDHYHPPADLSPHDRYSAKVFIQEQTGLIAELAGVKEQRVSLLLQQ